MAIRKKLQDNQTSTYFLYFLGFMDFCIVSMGLPLVARRSRELGATPSVVGLIASVYGGIQLFSSPMIGKFSDVSGRKKVLLIALGCTAVSYFVVGLSNSLIFLALSRILLGIFKQTQGLCKVSLADVTPVLERPKVFGYYNSIASAGFVIGPLVGGHIGMTENGFFKVMTLQAIGFIFLTVLAWYFLEIPDSGVAKHEEFPLSKSSSNETTNGKDTVKEEKARASKHLEKSRRNGLSSKLKSFNTEEFPLSKSSSNETTNGEVTSKEEKARASKHLEKSRRNGSSSILKTWLVKVENFLSIASLDNIIDLLLLRFVMGFSMIIFRSNFTTMLEFRYHTTPKTNGYIMSFNGMVSGLSGILVGYAVALYKHDNARAIFHCGLAITTALFCITFSPDLWVMVVLLVPLSFSTSVSRVCLSSLTLHRCNPDERGVILGVGNSLLSFARMLSPLLAGFAQETSVYGPGSISVIIAGIGCSISGLILNN